MDLFFLYSSSLCKCLIVLLMTNSNNTLKLTEEKIQYNPTLKTGSKSIVWGDVQTLKESTVHDYTSHDRWGREKCRTLLTLRRIFALLLLQKSNVFCYASVTYLTLESFPENKALKNTYVLLDSPYVYSAENNVINWAQTQKLY